MNQHVKGYMISKNFEIDADKSIFGNAHQSRLEDANDMAETIGDYAQNNDIKKDTESKDNQMSYSDHSIDSNYRDAYSKRKSNTIFHQGNNIFTFQAFYFTYKKLIEYVNLEENYGSQAADSHLLIKRKSVEKSFRK